MVSKFVKKFIEQSKKIYESGEKYIWTIPKGANKYRGDFGLLSEDKDIRSWQVPPTTAMLLRFFILSRKAKTILELGASVGYSTVWLGLGAKETGGHVYTTEIFKSKAKIARKNFKKAGLDNTITLYEKDILEVLKGWPKGRKIDFVFMDADKQRYGLYLKLMYPLLNDGAIIVVDNVGDYPEHMQEFLELCRSIEDAATYMLEIDHGLFLLAKKGGMNLMPLLQDEFPLFSSKTLKVLIKDNELLSFYRKYLQKRIHLRSDVLLIPQLLKMMGDVRGKRILALEWGPGRIALELAKKGAKVVKVDLEKHAELFKELNRNRENITYISSRAFRSKQFSFKGKFDIVFSYMFHLYLPSQKEFIDSLKTISRSLKKKGFLVYMDIQPFRAVIKSKVERGVISLHSPFYADYTRYTQLKAKLRTNEGTSLLSEYHRYPMSFIMNAFSVAGFAVEQYYEPQPSSRQMKKYPLLFSEEDRRIPPYVMIKLKKR